ncbi:MAG: twin-arginine translocase subunit TatC [Chloroflexota bacterium]
MRFFFRLLWRVITAPFRFLAWLPSGIRQAGEFLTFEPEDTPVGESLASAMEDPMGVLMHLNVLRVHLTRAVLVLALMTALSFTFVEPLLEILASPIEGGLDALRSIDPTETIGTVMRIALLAGFALAFPYIAFEVWLFVAPGVSARTRRFGLLGIPLTTLFFIFGMAFAFYVMLPVAMPFLFTFMGIETIPRPATYFPFVASLMFWIGMAFEFPLVIYILAAMKIVNARMLARQWRYAVVLIALLAAIITPTTDPVNMALVMAPMALLYCFGILLAFLARRGEAKPNAVG